MRRIVGWSVGLFVTLELIVRLLGLGDVPIREANQITGYIPVPTQSGRFLNRQWTINNLSMITTARYEKDPRSIVLAGDSVIFGGNLLSQSQRVGEQLNELVGGNVFSVADGSWGVKNSLAYFISRKEQLGDPREIVFVLNSEDFSVPSSWRCESTHPTARPVSQFYFAFRKYLWIDCETFVPAEVLVKDFDLYEAFDRFLAMYVNTKVVVVLYPTQEELKSNTASPFSIVDKISGDSLRRLVLIDLVQIARRHPDLWNQEMYADAIHPSPAGARALAHLLWSRVLSERVQSSRTP